MVIDLLDTFHLIPLSLSHLPRTVTQERINAKQEKMSSIRFVIGNTYTKLSDQRAQYDSTNNHLKVHNWTIYVDVFGNDADLIKKVEFDMGPSFTPHKFTSYCPIKVSENRWRFQSRQQTYGSVKVKVAIIGRGGSVRL